MEITIFAKKRNTKEGKLFITYLSTLTKKSGEKETVSVKFKDTCPAPKPEDCPLNIVIEKQNANLSSRMFTNPNNGEVAISKTLWVTEYTLGGEYVDTSLDDYE